MPNFRQQHADTARRVPALVAALAALAVAPAVADDHKDSKARDGAAEKTMQVTGVVIDLDLDEAFPLGPEHLWSAERLGGALTEHLTIDFGGDYRAEQDVLANAELSVYNRPAQTAIANKASGDTYFTVEDVQGESFDELFFDAEAEFVKAIDQVGPSWYVLDYMTPAPQALGGREEAVGRDAIPWDRAPEEATHAFRIEVVGRHLLRPGTAVVLFTTETPHGDMRQRGP